MNVAGIRVVLLMVLLVLLALGLGYVWPYTPPAGGAALARQWQGPAAPAKQTPRVQPELLARFWPLTKPEARPEADGKTDDEVQWQLVAVIRQGAVPQALVLSPQGQLHTLAAGDELDAGRRVTDIQPTALHWRAEQKQGTLALFPRPTATDSTHDTHDTHDE